MQRSSLCCRVCGVAANALSVCSGCKRVWYCGPKCQRKDWKTHKPLCQAISPEEFTRMLSLANDGDVEAQSFVSRCYIEGLGCEASSTDAIKWLRRAAGNGHLGSQAALGEFLRAGSVPGIAQDSKEAIFWLRKAADDGDATACFSFGQALYDGDGIAQDFVASAAYSRIAADAGVAAAAFHLGNRYFDGKGVPRANADGKNAEAAFNLAVMSRDGRGVPQDYEAELRFYQQASALGELRAHNNLAGILFEGRKGVPRDAKEAARLWRLAAEGGHARAALTVAGLYSNGNAAAGIAQDAVEAARWMHRSASGGVPEAQFFTGQAYEFGLGLAVNKSEATRWYTLAAAAGNEHAARKLREMPSSY